jgi:hypothetical protein
MPVPELLSGLEKRLTAELIQEAHQWAYGPNALSRWEDEHLLENPTPELLAEHAKTAQQLLRFGRWLSVATSHPDFPDRETAAMVEATIWTLEQMHNHWHRPRMSKERSDEILARAFPDEP